MNTQIHSRWWIIALIYTIPDMNEPVLTMALKQDKYNNKLIKLMKTNHCKMKHLKPVNSCNSLLTVYYHTEGQI